ncbi:hypothetical protein Pmani_022957 [Petrolisthes manimaculis]|uniref:Cytokine-inducible SH2-containing protein n=1 Tax=Petrolisthes manimaculis TaxID=1843537 RepID=A0AAE1PDH0_9EUCA|nr:hypothetical protein Pmani_022957 [Petrolisthes manimaculis]
MRDRGKGGITITKTEMMLVCPGCHIGLTATPTLSAPPPPHLVAAPHLATQPPHLPTLAPVATPAHWLTASHLASTGVQPPYVCGVMFQMRGEGVRHDTCHIHCCLPCTHSCPTTPRPTLLPVKVSCASQHGRTSSLHTSGGGLVMEEKKENRSIISSTQDATTPCPFLSALTPPPHHAAPANSTNPFLTCTPPTPTPTAPTTTSTTTTTTATTPPAVPPSAPSPVDSEDDSTVLSNTRQELEESGWYYGSITWQEAASLLKGSSVGTFLVRDSASPHCLYSLSVQTSRGPTSVRLHYTRGRFRLDCAGASAGGQQTPEFPSVTSLLQHYTNLPSTQVWVDHLGNTFSTIDIRRPLRRSAPSLQHLCRLTLNRTPPAPSILPPALANFLKAYPHTV